MFNKLSFKKKKTKIEQSVPEILTEENVDILGQDASLTGNRIANGVPSLKDLIAPASFDRSSPDHMQVGDKFVRNFIIAGFKLLLVGLTPYITTRAI